MKQPDVSIVVPVYFNEGSLELLTSEFKEKVILKNPDKTFEIIFVDDGSGDNSFSKLISLREKNKDLIKVIKLTRNFGQAKATLAGIEHSKGNATVVISADLQDPTELINDMINYYFNEKYQVVVCTREGRQESFFRKITSKFYYWLYRKLAIENMPKGGFDYLLISYKVKQYIVKYGGLKSNIFNFGFKPKFIYYVREKRPFGKSRYTFGKKFNSLVNLIVAYSFFPIRMMSAIGALTALVGFIWAIISTFYFFLVGTPFRGSRAIFVLILILSGIQMLMTGILGEYLWRALDQLRKRPDYVIDEIYE